MRMSKDFLELWGQTLLEMAKFVKGPQAFYDLFQNGFAKKEEKPDTINEQFINLSQKMFGKEGIETFNAIMKEFYENVGVVPRSQYNELHEKYIELKEKVHELERKIGELRKGIAGGMGTPSDLMVEWTGMLKRYSEINQQFFKEFSKFFEK